MRTLKSISLSQSAFSRKALFMRELFLNAMGWKALIQNYCQRVSCAFLIFIGLTLSSCQVVNPLSPTPKTTGSSEERQTLLNAMESRILTELESRQTQIIADAPYSINGLTGALQDIQKLKVQLEAVDAKQLNRNERQTLSWLLATEPKLASAKASWWQASHLAVIYHFGPDHLRPDLPDLDQQITRLETLMAELNITLEEQHRRGIGYHQGAIDDALAFCRYYSEPRHLVARIADVATYRGAHLIEVNLDALSDTYRSLCRTLSGFNRDRIETYVGINVSSDLSISIPTFPKTTFQRLGEEDQQKVLTLLSSFIATTPVRLDEWFEHRDISEILVAPQDPLNPEPVSYYAGLARFDTNFFAALTEADQLATTFGNSVPGAHVFEEGMPDCKFTCRDASRLAWQIYAGSLGAGMDSEESIRIWHLLAYLDQQTSREWAMESAAQWLAGQECPEPFARTLLHWIQINPGFFAEAYSLALEIEESRRNSVASGIPLQEFHQSILNKLRAGELITTINVVTAPTDS